MPDSSLLCLHAWGYWEQFTLHSELLVLASLKSNPCFLFIYSFLKESLTNIYWLPLGHNDALRCLKGQVRFSPWWKSSLSLILKMGWYWLLRKGVVGLYQDKGDLANSSWVSEHFLLSFHSILVLLLAQHLPQPSSGTWGRERHHLCPCNAQSSEPLCWRRNILPCILGNHKGDLATVSILTPHRERTLVD